jgi:hypothetical protein
MIVDHEESKGSGYEKKGLKEYVSPGCSTASAAALNSPSGQAAPHSDFVAGPPAYSSAGDASTSSAVVVASPSGNTLPVATPPSGAPTNCLSVFTVLEPIKGLWVRDECGMPNPNLHRSLGSWLLDPLIAPSSGPSILQTIVQHRAERRPRGFRNMTLGAPTAKLDSRHGNISAALRVVGESAMPATATVRSTTRSGNIVLELVSQSATCPRCPCLTIAIQVSKSPTRMVHFDAYSRSGKFKT